MPVCGCPLQPHPDLFIPVLTCVKLDDNHTARAVCGFPVQAGGGFFARSHAKTRMLLCGFRALCVKGKRSSATSSGERSVRALCVWCLQASTHAAPSRAHVHDAKWRVGVCVRGQRTLCAGAFFII